MKTKIFKYTLLMSIVLIGSINIGWSQNTVSLEEFLNRVGQKNSAYLSEKYNVAIADAEVVAQKVFPDPELELEMADDYYSVGLGYNLELGNKRGARVRLAKSQAELERLALEYYYQQLRAEATDLYLEAIEQKKLLEVKTSSYLYMMQMSKSDSIRLRSGEISELDARQTKLEASKLLNDVYDQNALYKNALVTLNRYMGNLSDTLWIPKDQWMTPDKDYVLPELISLGLSNNVELFAAHKSIDVAVNQEKLVKAERKMDLGLSISYERDWHGFIPPARSYVAGVSIPIKLSNTNKGALKSAKLEVEQTQMLKVDMESQVQAEISHAFFLYEAARSKVKHYESGLIDESKQILDGMVYKYRRGETSILEVLIAQREYNDLQEEYLGTLKEYSSTFVELQRSCGVWGL